MLSFLRLLLSFLHLFSFLYKVNINLRLGQPYLRVKPEVAWLETQG
jgi:hypothetical protein